MKTINPAAISARMLSDKELVQRLRAWAVTVENQRMYPTDKKLIAALLNASADRIASMPNRGGR